MKELEKLYSQWCKETKRSGSVLMRSSIYEFFDWLGENGYQLYKQSSATTNTTVLLCDEVKKVVDNDNAKKACNHQYVLTEESGYRVQKCIKCYDFRHVR